MLVPVDQRAVDMEEGSGKVTLLWSMMTIRSGDFGG